MPDIRVSRDEIHRLIMIGCDEVANSIRYQSMSGLPSHAWLDDKMSRLAFLTRQLLEPEPGSKLGPTWPPPPLKMPRKK